MRKIHNLSSADCRTSNKPRQSLPTKCDPLPPFPFLTTYRIQLPFFQPYTPTSHINTQPNTILNSDQKNKQTIERTSFQVQKAYANQCSNLYSISFIQMVCGVSQRKLHYMAALLQSLYRWHGGTLWWRERSDQYYLVNCQRYRAEYGKEKNHYVVFLTVRKVSKKRTFRTKNTSTTSDQQKKPRIRIDLARTRGRSSCAVFTASVSSSSGNYALGICIYVP